MEHHKRGRVIGRLSDERGMSLIDVLVGVVIVAVALLGLAAAGGIAARQVYLARAELSYWLAAQQQMETLLATDFDELSSGSGTLQGHAMTWTVTGTDPKRIELTVEYLNYRRLTVQKKVLMYVSAPELNVSGGG